MLIGSIVDQVARSLGAALGSAGATRAEASGKTHRVCQPRVVRALTGPEKGRLQERRGELEGLSRVVLFDEEVPQRLGRLPDGLGCRDGVHFTDLAGRVLPAAEIVDRLGALALLHGLEIRAHAAVEIGPAAPGQVAR